MKEENITRNATAIENRNVSNMQLPLKSQNDTNYAWKNVVRKSTPWKMHVIVTIVRIKVVPTNWNYY